MTSREGKGLWQLAGLLVLSVGFLCYAFTRQDPWHGAGAKNIMAAVITALVSLILLLYALLSPKAHAWFERVLAGLLAVAATTCTVLFGSAIWGNRATLGEDFGIFAFLALIFALALGVSLFAWWAFFMQFKSPR
jgi:hypothetical protein